VSTIAGPQFCSVDLEQITTTQGRTIFVDFERVAVSTDRTSTESRRGRKKASATPRVARKKAKSVPDEELSPERRVELAEQIEAKRWRRRPPSI
jgi:hypothetical protein